jgi:hypothetical protein
MTEAEFRTKRRQRFLTWKYFNLNLNDLLHSIANVSSAIQDESQRLALDPDCRASVFKNQFRLLRLSYTAGESIDSLRARYLEAMKWFDAWHATYRTQIASLSKETGDDLRSDGTPAWFEDLFHFQLIMDVVSVGILLGEMDAVRHAVSWLTRYRGTDMLFEALIEELVLDPCTDVEKFFHEKPYGQLVDAIFTAETSDDASSFVKKYLDNWYKSFDGVPWHDGHLVVTDEYSNYEGYWAFEAAAVCVLYDIDDSSFRDHIVYPKDFADWAREHKVADLLRPAADAAGDAILSCEGGHPCPREGWWFTPAREDSRRHFRAGESMPKFAGDYGATIWQWDANQRP